MIITTQISKHLREIYFGDNWTYSNLKEHLNDLSWEQATYKVHSFNTIATLVYHMTYYVRAVIVVLKGGDLDAKDAYSFNHPPIESQEDWEHFLDGIFTDVNKLADLIEQVPDNTLLEIFSEEKYGNYYRNFHGLIEHCHYHLGQIVIIKKLIALK